MRLLNLSAGTLARSFEKYTFHGVQIVREIAKQDQMRKYTIALFVIRKNLSHSLNLKYNFCFEERRSLAALSRL